MLPVTTTASYTLQVNFKSSGASTVGHTCVGQRLCIICE